MPSKICNANSNRLRGCKKKLYPTKEQKSLIDRNIEVSRAVYNIALEIQIKNRDDGNKFIQYYDMCSIISKLRNDDPKYQWLNDVSIGVIREALLDLDNAFMKFFNKINRFPKFKSKKSKKSFTTRSDRTRIKGSKIQLSGLSKELINAKKHQIPSDIPIHNPTVTYDGNDYWFSCTYERDPIDMSNKEKTDIIGIDVGIRNMITTSNGQFFHLPDTSKLENRLKRAQRRLQKDYDKYSNEAKRTRTKYENVPKSKNHLKRLEKQRKIYKKISNIRKNAIHNATKTIVENNPKGIVIENIKVNQIIYDNPWMKKYKPQMMFCEIHKQLQYKAQDRDIPVYQAPRNFKSTQTCSICGNEHKVTPGMKVFKCPFCHFEIDRDLNAAINLQYLVQDSNVREIYQIS